MREGHWWGRAGSAIEESARVHVLLSKPLENQTASGSRRKEERSCAITTQLGKQGEGHAVFPICVKNCWEKACSREREP